MNRTCRRKALVRILLLQQLILKCFTSSFVAKVIVCFGFFVLPRLRKILKDFFCPFIVFFFKLNLQNKCKMFW